MDVAIEIEDDRVLSSSRSIKSPPEYSESDPILSSSLGMNDEEMLTRGGSETERIKERKIWWKVVLDVIGLIFPIVTWLPEYCRKSEILTNVRRDVLAGCTIAIVLCPQGIAYALVAGMPPVYGIYSGKN